MQSAILGMLAETSIHPGCGQNVGVVDLPVAREAHTGYPVIVGSGMKGALRDKARGGISRKQESEAIQRVFGSQEAAGRVSVTDARLVLLPLRSLTGHFKWVTCPYILERLERDMRRMNCDWASPKLDIPAGQALVAAPGEATPTLFLEDLSFRGVHSPEIAPLAEQIGRLLSHPSVRDRLLSQLTVIANDEFAYFVDHGLPVNARNVLDDGKISQNLWYEESIPADSLFYSLLLSQDSEDLENLWSYFTASPYLQVGGNESIGYGWFHVTRLNPAGGQ